MDYTIILEILNQYGLIVVFVLIFAEYLNLPGFPATPILVAIGIWARYEHMLVEAFLISIIGAQFGTVILYGIGRLFGSVILERYYKRFPSHERRISNYVRRIDDDGPHVITIVRLIPIVRTIITIPAGLIKVDFRHFFWYSLLGIVIWNGVFIFVGSTVFEVVASVMLN